MFESKPSLINSEHNCKNIKHDVKGIIGTIGYSLDENIAAWQRLQYGMFIHWGIYSELGGVWNDKPIKEGYSEQIQMWANISKEDYLKIANAFTADKFNPKEICSLAKDAGMKYIVITSKHHDGFAMFDTATTDYNIVDSTLYRKDALKELANECGKQGLKFGVYFSLVDWSQGHAFDNNNCNPIPESMELIIEEQLRELMTNYGPIAEVWFDMSSPTQQQSRKFANIVRELQPQAVINSRIFNNIGDFRTLGDNEVPTRTLDGPWQTPASIYHSTWGYRSWQVRDDFEQKVRDLVIGLASITARGGNYLLNAGPRGDGSIVKFEANVLREVGEWIKRHPGAVIGASATHFGGQSWGEITVNNHDLFLHVINWPETGELRLSGLTTPVVKVQEDGDSCELKWMQEGSDLIISLPPKPKDQILPVIKVKLSGQLRIIPEKTLSVSDDGTLTIYPNDIYFGRSYADKGNYFNVRETIVRQTAYITTLKEGQIYLQLKGEANLNEKYRIEIGDDSYVVIGEQLTKGTIGPFTVPSNEVISLTITLAKPVHATKDMELRLESAHIIPMNNS